MCALGGDDFEKILMDPRNSPFVRERDGFSFSGEIWKVGSGEDLNLFMGSGVDLKNPRLRKEAAERERGNAVDAEPTVRESHR